MKKLTQKEGIAVATSMAVVAAILFGGLIWNFVTNPSPASINIPESGVQSSDLVVGGGETAEIGDTLTVHYTGQLLSGRTFDSSKDRNQPFTFVLGRGAVIRGWDEGLLGMREGGKRRLIIAPDYGYGAEPNGPIPADSHLIFEVELLEVKKASQ